MEVQIKNLIDIYENEVKKNVKNKKKIFEFERNEMEYFVDMKSKLENNEYDGGKYTIFLIF